MQHTFIILPVLLEGFYYRFRPPLRRTKVAFLTLLFALYSVNILIFGILYDDWIYPIIQVLNYGQKALFVSACYAFTLLNMLLSEKIYKLIS